MAFYKEALTRIISKRQLYCTLVLYMALSTDLNDVITYTLHQVQVSWVLLQCMHWYSANICVSSAAVDL